MCGIVGFFGKKDARDIVIGGLEKLEYRGYDSAGIALVHNNEIEIYKEKGRVQELKKLCDYSYSANIAIGHTRWATHGEPSVVNAHPHRSFNKRFVVVHNGVIDNYKILKSSYLKDYSFVSDTDTEVVINVIEEFAKTMSVKEAIIKTMDILEGSYAMLILDREDLGKMYLVKNKTPLLIGHGTDGITVGSDTMVLVETCDEYLVLNDKTFIIINNEHEFELYDADGNSLPYKMTKLDVKFEDFDKGTYEHYMLKEIEEQPGVIRNLISAYFEGDEVIVNQEIISAIRKCDKINLVACGTSMYASYMAKYYFEKLCGIPSEVFCASELVYSTPLIKDHPFFIFLSQSGETADSLAVMKNCKRKKYPTLAITNTENSSMNHLADYTMHIHAGKEIAVASTKAYVAQITTCAILAKAIAKTKIELKSAFNRVALAIENVLENKYMVKAIAEKLYKHNDVFYIGRGIDYWVCLESALKLKEISYIHTEAFPSGELKHGTIALIDKETPVIAICTQEGTNGIVRSNLTETLSRGATGYVISMEGIAHADDDIIIPNVPHYLTPVVSVVVTQLIAYYTAILRGNDVDKPKNLAKSVTVE